MPSLARRSNTALKLRTTLFRELPGACDTSPAIDFPIVKHTPHAFRATGTIERKQMNLPYTYQLLAAADAQRHGFIKLRGPQADHEVRLMSQAGLVDAGFDDGEEGSFTAINRITEAGHTFLRTFKRKTSPAAVTVDGTFTALQTAVPAS